MKLTKLFTGAAVAALVAGAAHGQARIGLQDDDANNIPALILASERTFNAANPVSGTLEFRLIDGPTATLFGGTGALGGRADTDSIDFTITLSGGMTFSSNLSNVNYTGATATCVLTIQSGGVSGQQEVTYRLVAGTPANNDAKDCVAGASNDNLGIVFNIPVNITGAGNVSTAVSLAATGTNLATATFDTDYGTAAVTGFVRTASGYNAEFAGNTGTSTIDLQATPVYTAFQGGNPVIGTVTIQDQADGGAFAGVLFDATNAATTTTSAAAAAQIDGGTLTVTFPNPAGIASVTLGLAAPVTQTLTNGVATFTLTQAQAAELVAAINITANAATGGAAAAIANQTPTLNFVTSTPAAARLTIPAEAENATRLVREGSNSTTFEWVGDATGSATNVWRFNGVSATNVPTIRATLSNSTAATSFNREYVVTPSGTVSAGGELVLTTADLQTAVGGNWGRADVQFSVEAAGVTVRRFLLGSNGTLTTFDGDFDISCGAVTGTTDATDATANRPVNLNANTCTQ